MIRLFCFLIFALLQSQALAVDSRLVTVKSPELPQFKATDILMANKQREISLGEAIAIAKRRYPGEVLSARRAVSSSGGTIYVIKILSSKGVVKKVKIDAASR